MQNIKILSIISIMMWQSFCWGSDWRVVISRAGFFGKVALGASYELTADHAFDFSLGSYHMGPDRHLQTNLSYRYSRWHVLLIDDEWRPLQIGMFVTHATGNDRYFYKSPNQYPESNYYDPTSIRYGLEFGTTYTWFPSRIGLSYHLRIFDTGFIALFNNSEKNLQYYISSGVSVHFLF